MSIAVDLLSTVRDEQRFRSIGFPCFSLGSAGRKIAAIGLAFFLLPVIFAEASNPPDRATPPTARQDVSERPGAPQNLVAAPGDGQVTLTWEAPASDGGSDIIGYEYRYAEGAAVPAATTWRYAGTGLTVTVGELTNATEYAFEVRAANSRGVGSSAAATATPRAATVPSAPQNVVAATEDGGIVLRWSAPADDGGSSILRYEMRNAEGASVPESAPWISTGSNTSGAFRQLTNGTLYSFEVRAVNAQGEGPAAQIQARAGLPPSAPQNLSAKPGHGLVLLTWDAPADSGTSAIVRYRYRYAEGATVPLETAW